MKKYSLHTVVWEKFVVGNIHEKRICGEKNLPLQTLINW